MNITHIPLSCIRKTIAAFPQLNTSAFMHKLQEECKVYVNSSPTTMPWGKHKGKLLTEVATTDPEYIKWLVEQDFVQEKFDDLYQTAKSLLQ